MVYDVRFNEQIEVKPWSQQKAVRVLPREREREGREAIQ